MEKDLTIIYLTASEINEKFAEYQRKVLVEAAGDYPIISVSRKPLDFGNKRIVESEPKCLSNIYWQMLFAAKMADTKYVAVAEDDVLYSPDHFTFYRPEDDTFAYNQNRWALFTWGDPIYSWRDRISNATLIAPRELLIEALEERFAKYPGGTPDFITGEVGRGMVERNMGLTERKAKEVFSEVSNIQLNHDNASEDRQVRHRKALGQMKAYNLYHWGDAKDVLKHYG